MSRDEPLARVYFDTNAGDGRDRYWLGLSSSNEDLARIPNLRNGMRVVIYMTRELEMEATLEYDSDLQAWMAVPIAGTIKYYPEGLPE